MTVVFAGQNDLLFDSPGHMTKIAAKPMRYFKTLHHQKQNTKVKPVLSSHSEKTKQMFVFFKTDYCLM